MSWFRKSDTPAAATGAAAPQAARETGRFSGAGEGPSSSRDYERPNRLSAPGPATGRDGPGAPRPRRILCTARPS